MAVRISYETHTVCFVSKVLAQEGGAHIVNVTLNDEADNGKIISLGDWIELDHYQEKDYTGSFKGVIRQKSQRPDFYFVEVTEPGDAWFVYQVPVNPYTFSRTAADLARFYNDPADGAVRTYQLSKHDIVEISKEGFVGDPEVGKDVSVDTTGKLKVAG